MPPESRLKVTCVVSDNARAQGGAINTYAVSAEVIEEQNRFRLHLQYNTLPLNMPPPSTFTLNTGAKIPVVGLGTWQSQPGEVADAVEHALKSGYRHIDGALVYQNEAEVGEGIKRSGLPREEIFVTTKLWNTYHRRVEECLDKSLKDLGLEYVDLYLMHWPVPMSENGDHPLFPKLKDGSRDLDREWSYKQTWKEIEKLIKTGKVKAIGVSVSKSLHSNLADIESWTDV